MTGNYGSMSQRPRSKTTIAPLKYFVGGVVTQNNEIEAITTYIKNTMIARWNLNFI